MALHPRNKYHLKDLYREIDLFDRKIAHSEIHAVFATEELRLVEIKKLRTKRGTLVKVAAELVSEGIGFEQKDLPRSFKTADDSPEPAQAV